MSEQIGTIVAILVQVRLVCDRCRGPAIELKKAKATVRGCGTLEVGEAEPTTGEVVCKECLQKDYDAEEADRKKRHHARAWHNKQVAKFPKSKPTGKDRA